MAHLSRSYRRVRREPTIALINIVFLMLIFFMVAGTLAPPLDEVELVETADLEGRQPPDAPVLTADGRLLLRGREVTPEEVIIPDEPMRLVPDRAVPATVLVEVAQKMRAAGASAVNLVTARGLE